MILKLLTGLFLVSFVAIVLGIGVSVFHPVWVAAILVWLVLATVASFAVLIFDRA